MDIEKCQNIQRNFEYFFETISKNTINTGNFKCVMSNIPDPYFNSIINTNVCETDIDTIIIDLKSRYKKENKRHSWWYNDLTMPTDLPQRLMKHHYKPSVTFMGLSYDLTHYQINNTEDEDYLVVHLTDPKQLTYWIYPFLEYNNYKNHIGRKIFERYNELFDTDKSLMHSVVFYKQQPVGCGSLLIKDRCAGLYNVSFIDKTNQSKVIQLLKTARLNLAKKNHCSTAVIQVPYNIHCKGFYNDFDINMTYKFFIG